MKYYNSIYSLTEPAPVEITKTKVLIASNIQQNTYINDRDETMICFSYDITEYDKDEYLTILSQNQQDIAALQEELRAAKILLGVE